jgi:HAE1 family hydrophobic/amphiphilic exporter-1
MNPIRIFIERPVATTLVMLGILLFGWIGYTQLPVSDLPNVEFPTISVNASLPGANPDTMAASVATPLEQQFSTIAGLDSMSSTSSSGSVQITLQFSLDRDIDAAAQDVQAAISTATRKLPQDMNSPPSLRKVNPADQPIYFVTVSSKTLQMYEVNEYADKMVAQRLSMVAGVAQVNVFGSQKYAVRIQLDPALLAAKNVGINEVSSAIQQGNSNLPIGNLYTDERSYTIKSNGQLMNADAFRQLIVTYREGSPVYLSDLAKVIDSVENSRQASWFNRERAVVLAIQKQPGTNTIAVIDKIEAMLPLIQADLPPAVNISKMFDRSVAIRNSVHEVEFTLILTIILVVFVIYLFLGNFSATWIASLALPMSIVGTFAVMNMLGFSLNNLSLMAIILAVGFIVDDAIVVLENIMRHLEMGENPLQAALKGSQEIAFTVLSMTLSLVAVFIPILFMSGLLGRLFNEFAVTMAVAILVSCFISLSLTPMLCSRYLKVHHGKNNFLVDWANRAFLWITHLYEVTLKKTLAMKPLVMVVFFILCGVTAYFFVLIPKGFMPSDDIGQIAGNFESVQGTPFQDMGRYQSEIAKIVLENPNVASVMTSISGTNSGRFFVTLKPFGTRESVQEVVKQLRPKVSKVLGVRVFLQIPPSIRLGAGPPGKAVYQFTLQSPDIEALYTGTAALEKKLHEIPGLQDINSNLEIKNPELVLKVNRERAAALGLSQQQIESALSSSFGTRQISTIYASTNDYQVILELDPAYQNKIEALDMVYVRSANQGLVPVSTVATVERSVGPLTVNHQGTFPSTSISFNLPPEVPLGSVVSQIQTLADQTLPENVRTTFEGTAQLFQDSLQGLGILLLVAVLVIYLVLGILYESFIHPITILSGLPPAALGALGALLLFNQELNIYGFLGLIMLIGIVKKNAIMMIDFALDAQRNRNKNPEEAIFEACLVRFRPIMMTTFAALMGAVPIAFGIEIRRSLGLTVLGGLLVSQVLTLYLTPVLYIYFSRLMGLLGRKKTLPVSSPQGINSSKTPVA